MVAGTGLTDGKTYCSAYVLSEWKVIGEATPAHWELEVDGARYGRAHKSIMANPEECVKSEKEHVYGRSPAPCSYTAGATYINLL